MKILAISGSLRDASSNTRLLRALAEEAPDGVTVELWDGLEAMPPYDQDVEDGPKPHPAVVALREAVADADAVIFATPEYNSSIPGVLKNAVDWASRPIATNVFRNKPVGVISSSAGAFGGVWAAAELRKVLAAMGARVAEIEVAVGHAAEKLDGEGNLTDDETRDQLREALHVLLAAVDARLSAVSA